MVEPRLSGRSAIVTGGGRGIGRAIAVRLAAEGAAVAICGREESVLNTVVDEIIATGGRATRRVVDVSDEAQVDMFVADTFTLYGGLDILVNNAALTASSNIGFAPLVDMTSQEWLRTLGINLHGVFYASRAVGRIMRAARKGSIINISSVHAQIQNATTPHYDASKAAIESMTKNMALHMGQFKVRVNAIAPGPIDVWAGTGKPDPITPEQRERMKASTALGRSGRPDEIAAAAAFLASDDASYITGSTLVVDGGWLLRHPGMDDANEG